MRPITGYAVSFIATTGDRFSGFSPYVPSINSDGIVAFQATLAGGASGVFAGDGKTVELVVAAPERSILKFCSHPAINRGRTIGVYGAIATGVHTLVIGRAGHLKPLDQKASRFVSAGPLGPTVNEAGTVAFRAGITDGDSGVFTCSDGIVELVASTTGEFSEFHGLPLIDRDDGVRFRAELKTGAHGIFHALAGRTTSLVETGDGFLELGFFPAINSSGTMAFVGISRTDGAGVFTHSGGKPTIAFGNARYFESFRGALVNDAGDLVFYATPVGGRLGIYFGPDPGTHKILGIGTDLRGSTVTDFALNPVSINAAGQLAMRASLADGRQMILRIDPMA